MKGERGKRWQVRVKSSPVSQSALLAEEREEGPE